MAALFVGGGLVFVAQPGQHGANLIRLVRTNPSPFSYSKAGVIVAFQDFVEEVQVLGRDLVEKVKSLIHEGNVRRIIVRDEHGNTFVEIPVTVAAVSAVLAPVLAALGAISALVAKFTIVVVRAGDKPSA